MEAADANKQEIREREARWGKPVFAASLLAIAFYIGSGLVVSLGDLIDRDTKATEVASFHDHSSGLLLSAGMSAVGSLLLIVPLYFLFRAAQDRNPDVKGALLPFVFIGPIALAAQSILAWAANRSVADDFVDKVGSLTGDQASDLAQKMLDDSQFVQIAGGIAIPAVFGLIVAVFYTSLIAMRTGLVSRFWGTFGMAFAVGILILGLIGVMAFVFYIGLLAAGLIARPPAWEAVETIPLPSSGMRPDGPADGPALGDSPIETDGREIDTGVAGPAPRKRKRRG